MKTLTRSCALFAAFTLSLAACDKNEAPAKSGAGDSTTSASSAASSTPAPASSGTPKVYDQTATSIDAKVGDKFIVTLPGSTSTPFEWKLDQPGDAVVVTMTDKGNAETPPPGCQGCTGYKGTFNFTFSANASGNTKLHFVYARVAPPGSAPTKDATIDVHVTK
jgi:predicted secreted protein